ncbi:CSEP0394 putative effector protein [Blumeria hordei DH14]|uniref:CSEP0394 putative effector protein n=1 Tax=Blumeria graminis f. sp. hordei (strain DH14) TaxID=546991 RepID=N1JDN3_BLUG1|nr:CSEP0394 putative effector protein [Blumeria hordei DH14]
MTCVFAFLLATSGHMVITGFTASEDHYGLYQTQNRYYFPEPKANMEVYLFTQKVISSGTNYAMYCSPLKRMSEIVENIEGLLPVDSQNEPQTAKYTMAKRDCLQKIRSLSHPVTLSKLLQGERKDNACTSNIIFSLIFTQQVKMTGNFNCFLPLRRVINVPMIKADKSMNLKDILPSEKMLLAASRENVDLALIWHHGHLILLEGSKKRDKTIWKPRTRINDELLTAKYITEFMTNNFPEVKSVKAKITSLYLHITYLNFLKGLESEGSTSSAGISISQVYESKFGSLYKDFAQKSRRSLEQKLFEVTPRGYLCDQNLYTN